VSRVPARDGKEDTMDKESESSAVRTFAAGLLIGALLGAGMTLLLAPQSGEETRRLLTRRARRLAEDARDRYDDVKHQLRRAREHRRRDREDASAG
jgi:gas vesicle protein